MRIPSPRAIKELFSSRVGILIACLVILLVLVLTVGNVRKREKERRNARQDETPVKVIGAGDGSKEESINRMTAPKLPDPTPVRAASRPVVATAAPPSPASSATPLPPPERTGLASSPVGLAAKPVATRRRLPQRWTQGWCGRKGDGAFRRNLRPMVA